MGKCNKMREKKSFLGVFLGDFKTLNRKCVKEGNKKKNTTAFFLYIE